METKKMKVKDILTIVLLSLINIVIFGFGSLFYLSPFTVLLMPVFYSLFQGIVFYVIGAKVRKPGAIILYCAIQGIIGFNLIYILMFLLAGAIGELIVYKMGYGNHKGIGLSYIIMQMLAGFGSTIYPYAIALDKTLEQHGDGSDYLENVRQAGEMIQSWGVIILIILVLISAIIGAIFGYLVTKKHFASQTIELTDEEVEELTSEEEKEIEELMQREEELKNKNTEALEEQHHHNHECHCGCCCENEDEEEIKDEK